MTLDEIHTFVSARSPYPIISAVDDHDAVVLLLGKGEKGFQSPVCAVSISRLELASAKDEMAVLAARTDAAVAMLDRSVAPA